MDPGGTAHEDDRRVDCMRCAHFYVTWEPAHPRGCRAFAFKTRELPSLVVERESGTPCQLYEPKPARGS